MQIWLHSFDVLALPLVYSNLRTLRMGTCAIRIAIRNVRYVCCAFCLFRFDAFRIRLFRAGLCRAEFGFALCMACFAWSLQDFDLALCIFASSAFVFIHIFACSISVLLLEVVAVFSRWAMCSVGFIRIPV